MNILEWDNPCPCCGEMRQRIGQETSWQVEFNPGHFERLEHARFKYACKRCEQDAVNPQIVLADKPIQPIDKGMAGPGLLAYVVTSKFADYLPLSDWNRSSRATDWRLAAPPRASGAGTRPRSSSPSTT